MTLKAFCNTYAKTPESDFNEAIDLLISQGQKFFPSEADFNKALFQVREKHRQDKKEKEQQKPLYAMSKKHYWEKFGPTCPVAKQSKTFTGEDLEPQKL